MHSQVRARIRMKHARRALPRTVRVHDVHTLKRAHRCITPMRNAREGAGSERAARPCAGDIDTYRVLRGDGRYGLRAGRALK